jgi:PAS domain S-box-containing protein
VKRYISKNEKVYVSMAPSFVASFEQDRDWIFAALKRLGFSYIEETAVGAELVSKMYGQLLNQKIMKNIITTACPSINYLIEKYYSELISQMAPVVSPLIAHAKLLRERYGELIRIVFIGPCISKYEECSDSQNEGLVDAVLTFEELYDWMTAEGIDDKTDLSKELCEVRETMARIYPIPGGIIKTLDKQSRKNYHCISVDGVERCKEILDSLKKDKIRNYFIEMNSCNGGCIGGPYMRQLPGGFLEARRRVLDYTKKGLRGVPVSHTRINLRQTFQDRSVKNEIPSQATIQGILNSIGKFTKDDELNCGSCGYKSCMDKAIAVYQEKAQLHMCLPYMRERAESISDLILNTTPNGIIAIDEKLRIQQINKSALEMFQLDKDNIEDLSIWDVIPYDNFHLIMKRKENIYDKHYYFDKYQITVNQSIIFVEKQNIIVLVFKDISEEEKKRKELLEIRRETADITQKVIEKQMRVAQEIASLLGETTAETKVTLSKLKETIMPEKSEDS